MEMNRRKRTMTSLLGRRQSHATSSKETIVSKTSQLILGSILAAGLVTPTNAHAAELRSVACTVSVNYLLDGVVRAPYQKDFVITPGVVFEDDFSTITRFRIFNASSRLEADNKTTTVSISYFNDVGVFESIDFNTELKLPNGRTPETTSGSHTYWSSLGVAGNHTTSYALTCQVQKD